MKINYFRKNYKIVLAVIAMLVFLVSIVVHTQQNFPVYRALRTLICTIFLVLLFLFNGRKANPLLVLFLTFYGASSFATIWYENGAIATLAMILNFIASLFLIFAVAPKVNFRKMNSVFTVIFLLMVLFNAYLLYELIQMIKEYTLSNAHYGFMLLGAMSLVILAFLSLLYNYIYSTKASLLFVSFILVLIFSEIFRAIGYYDFAYGNIAVYIARGLFILALSFLVQYTQVKKKGNELLSRRLM